MNGQRRDITEIQRGAIHKLYLNGNKEYTKAEQARAASIQAEANRKRREKAKEQHAVSTPRRGETMVVVPEEQVPNEADRAPGRAARAEDAGVSPSTSP